MGTCCSVEHVHDTKETPSAAELGLPASFEVVKELQRNGVETCYVVRESTGRSRSEVWMLQFVRRGRHLNEDTLLHDILKQCMCVHVNLLRLHEVLLTSTHLVFKYEHAAGGELLEYVLRQKRATNTQLLSEEHARYFFKQLVSAVQYSQQLNVLRADLRLCNVLLDGSTPPRIKLLTSHDTFQPPRPPQPPSSFSHKRQAASQQRNKEGTAMSHGGSGGQQCDDVWSCGVILFVMLLGRLPFSHWSRDDMSCGTRQHARKRNGGGAAHAMSHPQHADCARDMLASSDLSAECRSLLEGMLAMDRSLRVNVDGVFAHPWFTAPLQLQHGRALAKCRDEQDCWAAVQRGGQLSQQSRDELHALVHDATSERAFAGDSAAGSNNDVLRWSPPAVQRIPSISTPVACRGHSDLGSSTYFNARVAWQTCE